MLAHTGGSAVCASRDNVKRHTLGDVMGRVSILLFLTVLFSSCEEPVGPSDGESEPHIFVDAFHISIHHTRDIYDPDGWSAIVDFDFELIGSAGYLHTMRLNLQSPSAVSIVCHYPLICEQGGSCDYCPIPMNRLQEEIQYIRMPEELDFSQYDSLIVDVVLEGEFNWCSHNVREPWHKTLGDFVWSESIMATIEQ